MIRCEADAGFTRWLAHSGGSIAVSCYQANALLLIGWNGREVTLLERGFERSMGIDVQGDQLAIVWQGHIGLWRNARALAALYDDGDGTDALYLPQRLLAAPRNAHDAAFGTAGLWYVDTRNSVLRVAGDSAEHWRPPFVTATEPEDRCHLNGLALRDGKPAFVTCLGETDEAMGWRPNRRAGGIIVNVETGQVIARGLCIPHSPRLLDGHLHVLNSGEGQLLRIGSTIDVIAELPAYLRGLDFAQGAAIAGMCRMRASNAFGGVPVAHRNPELLAGVAVIDVATGRPIGAMHFAEGCREVYDVRFLPSVRAPNLIAFDDVASYSAAA